MSDAALTGNHDTAGEAVSPMTLDGSDRLLPASQVALLSLVLVAASIVALLIG